jgi:hypothetical protein
MKGKERDCEVGDPYVAVKGRLSKLPRSGRSIS